jgi:PAS domain S-box-containing protein
MGTSKAPALENGSPTLLPHFDDSHVVQFYQEDHAPLEELARLIGTSLVSGDAALVIATKAHRDGLERELKARNLDITEAVAEGCYVSLDAAETLSQFMVGSMPDPGLFTEMMGGIIEKAKAAAKDDQPCIVILGEMVALLWAEGKYEAAIRLEQLWNDLANKHSFSLRCVYPMNGFYKDEHSELFMRICAEHSTVVPEGGYALLLSDDERLRTIAKLQQQVQVLEREKALRESERRFRLLVEAVQDYAIFMLDAEGRVNSWNIGAERIKGYKASEIIGKHFSCFYPEEDIEIAKPQRELVIAAREGRIEDEGWRVRKDGSRFWANVVISALKDDAGNIAGFSKVTRDVTDRRQATKRLEEQAALLQLAHDAIIVRDLHGVIRFWNRGAEEMYGWSQEAVLGKTTHSLLRTEFPASLEDINGTLLHMGMWDGELVHTKRDGARVVVASRWALRRDIDVHPTVVLEINTDITEGKQAQESLRREVTERREAQQKLQASEKSLRQLSLHLLQTQDEERRRIGRDLHDSVGQYLSALKVKLDLLNRPARLADINTVQRDLSQCAELAEEVIKEVRTISYLLYPPLLDEMGLESAIAWYVEGFAKRSGIQTTFEDHGNFGRLPCDVEMAMFRVVQESLTNVHRHSGSPSAEIRLSANDGEVSLEIRDKGKGMPVANLEETGQRWMGTLGVGLRGMTERMRQLGGRLELLSSAEGTAVIAIVPWQESSSVALPHEQLPSD